MAIGNKIASCWIAINQCFTSNRDKKQAFISRVSHYEHRCRRGQGEQNGGQKENTNPYLSPFAVLIMIDTHISRSFSLDRMHLLSFFNHNFFPTISASDLCLLQVSHAYVVNQQVRILHFISYQFSNQKKKMISSDCFSVN